MGKSDRDDEFPTDQHLLEIMREILSLLSSHFKGETTLNHLRIGNYIGWKTLIKREVTNNKDISQALDISRSTVTRVVTDLIEHGYVVENMHPDDGRVRLVAITDGHPQALGFETDFRSVISEYIHIRSNLQTDGQVR